jgi:hypothetical protein
VHEGLINQATGAINNALGGPPPRDLRPKTSRITRKACGLRSRPSSDWDGSTPVVRRVARRISRRSRWRMDPSRCTTRGSTWFPAVAPRVPRIGYARRSHEARSSSMIRTPAGVAAAAATTLRTTAATSTERCRTSIPRAPSSASQVCLSTPYATR